MLVLSILIFLIPIIVVIIEINQFTKRGWTKKEEEYFFKGLQHSMTVSGCLLLSLILLCLKFFI